MLRKQPAPRQPGQPARPVLSLPELDVRLRTFLVETYQQRVHSEPGVAPALRWEAGGFLPRLPDSADQLDLLLLTVAKPRRVHATARSGRPSPHRPGAHRHARPAEATGTLRAAVLTRWLRASVPAPERTGVSECGRASMGAVAAGLGDGSRHGCCRSQRNRAGHWR